MQRVEAVCLSLIVGLTLVACSSRQPVATSEQGVPAEVAETSEQPAAGSNAFLGETTYTAQCSPCHGVNREGAGIGPPLQGLAARRSPSYVRDLVRQGGSFMPSFRNLSDTEMEALLEFLLELPTQL